MIGFDQNAQRKAGGKIASCYVINSIDYFSGSSITPDAFRIARTS